MIAQERLRHKTKKVSFRIIFWLTVFANVGIIYSVHTALGSKILKAFMDSIEYVIVEEINPDKTQNIFLFLVDIDS